LVRALQSAKARAIRITERLEKFADELLVTQPGFRAGGSGPIQQTRAWRVVMKNLFARFVREENGQDLIEYALLGSLIAVACVLAMSSLATAINGVFSTISSKL
jgi:pilus assembly protein Flp/PilA